MQLIVEELNVAVTLLSELIEIAQGAVPVQPPPDQPANVEPKSEVAVRVTLAPSEYEVEAPEQLVPQLIPTGLVPNGALVTVPVPLPNLETDKV